jgi:DNA-binding SARP family transcriptional activator
MMTIYADMGRPDHALDAYERLADVLKTSLNVDPDPQTKELAKRFQS